MQCVKFQLTDVSEIKSLCPPEDGVLGDGLSSDLEHGAFLSVAWEGVGQLKLECPIRELFALGDPTARLPAFTATEAISKTWRHIFKWVRNGVCVLSACHSILMLPHLFYLTLTMFLLPVAALSKAHGSVSREQPLTAEGTVVRPCPTNKWTICEGPKKKV